MRRAAFFLCLCFLLLPVFTVGALEASWASAVLFDYSSSQVLYAQHPHERLPPASTTKVMTAILALELGQLTDAVAISHRAAATAGSSIYLQAGEVLTLEQLLWGLLLESGNDAAVAIAEHLGGSVENFAGMMNQLAYALGAVNTTFMNPHGLPQEGHHTTAYDLALITRYALENPLFSSMVETRSHTIPWGQEGDRLLKNSNRLLYSYPSADGVKTGWTQAAGPCLISSATKEGRRLIAVILNSSNMYQDSAALLEYGFTQFTTRTIIQKGETLFHVPLPDAPHQRVNLITGASLYRSFPLGGSTTIQRSIRWREDLSYPLLGNQPVAWMEVAITGEQVGRVPLLLEDGVQKPSLWRIIWEKIQGLLSILPFSFTKEGRQRKVR